MAEWSLCFILFGRFRLGVVTRRRLTDMLYALLLSIAVLGDLQVGGAAQVVSVLILTLLLPLALRTSLPAIRYLTFEWRVLSRAASAMRSTVGNVVQRIAAALAGATYVAFSRATDCLSRVREVIAGRLHGLPHACVLRARLTTAIATGC